MYRAYSNGLRACTWQLTVAWILQYQHSHLSWLPVLTTTLAVNRCERRFVFRELVDTGKLPGPGPFCRLSVTSTFLKLLSTQPLAPAPHPPLSVFSAQAAVPSSIDSLPSNVELSSLSSTQPFAASSWSQLSSFQSESLLPSFAMSSGTASAKQHNMMTTKYLW